MTVGSSPEPRFEAVSFDHVAATRCPCGWARRAFAGISGGVASMHVVTIESDSQLHYHKRMTEFYYVLEGDGVIEADGQVIPAHPGVALMIKPGCRHRARGRLTILNLPVPAFDPQDEYV